MSRIYSTSYHSYFQSCAFSRVIPLPTPNNALSFSGNPPILPYICILNCLMPPQEKKGTLPETNSNFAPENRPKPNRKGSYSNHPFLGAKAVSFREGVIQKWGPYESHPMTFRWVFPKILDRPSRRIESRKLFMHRLEHRVEILIPQKHHWVTVTLTLSTSPWGEHWIFVRCECVCIIYIYGLFTPIIYYIIIYYIIMLFYTNALFYVMIDTSTRYI